MKRERFVDLGAAASGMWPTHSPDPGLVASDRARRVEIAVTRPKLENKMVSSPTRERCLLSNHAAGLQKRVCIFAPSASIEAQPPLNGGGRLSRSPTAATAAAGPRRRPSGCCSSSQRLPLATRGVRTRVWGRVVHRLDAGRAQRPPVGAARASEAVALWAFRGAPIASRNSATLTLAHRRYTARLF